MTAALGVKSILAVHYINTGGVSQLRREMVFPGRLSTGCYLCRKRKVKVGPRYSRLISKLLQDFFEIFTSVSCSATIQNPPAVDVSLIGLNVPDTRMHSHFVPTSQAR